MRLLPARGMTLATLLAVMSFADRASAHEVIYQAHATGIKGTVQAAGVTKKVLIVDNSMSCRHDAVEETASSVDTPEPLLTRVRTVTTFTQGDDDQADARSYLEDLLIEVPGLKVTALAVGSWAQARCDATTGIETATGGADIVDVTINGERIEVTSAPNQKVTIDGVAEVIFNERTVWKKEYKSNAMHIKLFNSDFPANGDIIVGYSRAKIECDI